jgi:hypothetical protein
VALEDYVEVLTFDVQQAFPTQPLSDLKHFQGSEPAAGVDASIPCKQHFLRRFQIRCKLFATERMN